MRATSSPHERALGGVDRGGMLCKVVHVQRRMLD